MGKTLIRPGQIKPFTEAEALELFAQTLYNLALLKTTATKTELDYLSGVASPIQIQINEKLDKTKLKSNGAVDWTDDTTTATALAIARRVEEAVANAQIGGAMVFKGKWRTKPMPTTAAPIKAGYTYTYDSGTPPTGATLEAGDMLTASIDMKTTADANNMANWVIVQTNIAGAVTTIESQLLEGRILVGAGGKTIGQANVTGLLKGTAGVVSPASKSDVVTLVGNAVTIGNASGAGVFNLSLGDILSFASSGGASVTFDAATKKVVISAPPSVSIAAGAPVNGQYITGLSISSDGTISVTRATIPADVTMVTKTSTSISGTKNGINTQFVLPENVVAGSVMLFLNGQCLVQGVDYTLSGAGNRNITFASDSNIPVATDTLSVNYVKM